MEIYQFMRTFWHVPLMMPLHDHVEIEVSERWLTAQQKDERRQDNGDKKRLRVTTYLIPKRIGGGQHGVVSPALRASPFRSIHVLRVRHLMRMRISSLGY